MEFLCQLHRQVNHDKPITHSWVTDILCSKIREMLTFSVSLSVQNKHSNYIQNLHLKTIIWNINYYLSGPSYETLYYLYLSTIVYFNHKGSPSIIGTLWSYKQAYISKPFYNRSMGPVLIWPNITIVVNVVFEILTLTRVWYIVSSRLCIQKSSYY